MSQRIADGQLKKLATDLDRFPDNSRFIGYEVVTAAILDLRESRAENVTLKARIAELEHLSSSQEQAHALRDAGGKL